MNKPYDPDSISRLVREYLDGFHGHYKLPRHHEQEVELLEWCTQLGAIYKDWSYYKGHPKDSYCVLHIKNPKWCTLFELSWGHLVIGVLDRPKSNCYNLNK